MITKKEVCDLANKMAKEQGKKPSELMGKAWEELRKKEGLSTKRKPIKIEPEDDSEANSHRTNNHRREKPNKFVTKAKGKIADSTKATVRSINFTKSPKDSPQRITNVFKNHDPMPKVPDSLKNLFKIR